MHANRTASHLLLLISTGMLLILCSCRTHPELIRDARRNLAQGNAAGVLKVFPQDIDPDSRNGLLYLCERARLNHDLGNFQASLEDIIRIQEYERRKEETEAALRLSPTADQTAAVLTNDEALPYKLCDFERNMLFQTAGFNVLYENSQDLPAVISNLTAILEKQRRHAGSSTESLEKQITRQNSSNTRRSLRMLQKNSVFQQHQEDADKIAKGLASSENACSYYFCGLYFEAQGDYGSALLAYQTAYLLVPANSCFRDTFIQTARQCRRPELIQRYGLEKTAAALPQTDPTHGDVIVFFESGWIPAKLPYKVSLPVYTDKNGFILISLSFPYYPDSNAPSPVLDLKVDGRNLPVQNAANLHHFAIRQLRSQMPGIITRMFLRASSRALAAYAANKAIEDIQDSTARSLARIGSIFTQTGLAELEQPDLRSFLSLPHRLQIARISLPAGSHRLQISSCGRSRQSSLTIRPGEKKILQILAAPEFLSIRSAVMPNMNERKAILPVK